MKHRMLSIVGLACLYWACAGHEQRAERGAELRGRQGHGAFRGSAWLHRLQPRPLPPGSAYSAGMGFYAAVWPLVDQPLADFQIGLPSSWITPDNSDNKDQPLAPEGTLARTWRERGPTWSSVFQTVEGGLGYWAGNHFRYGPPKFSMNATPQCYDYEVGSPGWSFFYSNEALPDNRLGIAQLSNRLLIPPDALPFQGNPNGEFLGYTWMALPFTDPTTGDPPTGDQSWTCFLSAANFKGPIAYYIPETWSKIGKLFQLSLPLRTRPRCAAGHHGRRRHGDQHRAALRRQRRAGDGLLEDSRSCSSRWMPRAGRLLVQDVTYYSKSGPLRRLQGLARRWPCLLRAVRREGRLEAQADDAHHALRPGRARKSPAWSASSTPGSSRATSGACSGSPTTSARRVCSRSTTSTSEKSASRWRRRTCRAETRLLDAGVQAGQAGRALHVARRRRLESARSEARTVHGQARRRFRGDLLVVPLCGSAVLPAIPLERRRRRRSCRRSWRSSMRTGRLTATTWPRPAAGELVSLDPALLVTPPEGLEVGYVPIVTRSGGAVMLGRGRSRPNIEHPMEGE